MTDHREWQEEVPAYVAGRLGDEARQAFEAHLSECDACSEIAATWKEIASSMRRGGEELSSAHPDEMALRDYATGGATLANRDVARHIVYCASCELEVSAWKAREAGLRSPAGGEVRSAPAGPWPAGARVAVVAVAIGIIVGVGLAIVLRPAPPAGIQIARQDPSVRPAGPEPVGPSPGGAPQPTGPLAAPAGPVQLLVLGGALRGGEPAPAFRIGAAQPFVLVAVQPTLPARAGADDLYRFEVVRAGGEVVWSSEQTVAQIRPHLESSEVITFAIPSEALPAGHYEMRVAARGAPGAGPIVRIPFDILPQARTGS